MADRLLEPVDRLFQNELNAYRQLVRSLLVGQGDRMRYFKGVNKSLLFQDVSPISGELGGFLDRLPKEVEVRISDINGICILSVEHKERDVLQGIQFADLPGRSNPDSMIYNISTFEEASMVNQMLENVAEIEASRIKGS